MLLGTKTFKKLEMTYRYLKDGFVELPSDDIHGSRFRSGIAVQLSPKAKLPTRANPTDAGADLYMYLGPEDDLQNSFVVIKPQEQLLIDTGVAFKIPNGYAGFVMARSSMRNKRITAWGDGLIDSAYRGTVKVVVSNQSDKDYVINNGDRIGQLVIQKIELVEFIDIWNDTERGTGGFGSTGK